jgi:1-phosphofructokinase family hexose kinase
MQIDPASPGTIAMILTVTANAALDRLLVIDELKPATTMRASRTVDYVGGKGFDSSVALTGLGVPNRALGFLAGEIGRRLFTLLEGYGIQTEIVWVEGETRIAHVIVETRLHRHSHIITQGYHVTPVDLQRFLERFEACLSGISWVILSGSLAPGLPPDFYGQLIEIAARESVPALVDVGGEPARQAGLVRPAVLKMNVQEFSATFGGDPSSTGELVAQARQVCEQLKLPALVLTRGEKGLLAIRQQEAYLASCPAQPAVSAAGAGDAVSAALAWRLAQSMAAPATQNQAGDPWLDAMRWAAAAGTAGVLTEGTGELHLADVHRFYVLAQVEML